MRWMVALCMWGLVAAACSSSDDAAEPAKWRCSNGLATDTNYCECFLMTDSQAAELGVEDAPSYCLPGNHKCCEVVPAEESYQDVDSCFCWNPEAVSACDGFREMVDACPASSSD